MLKVKNKKLKINSHIVLSNNYKLNSLTEKTTRFFTFYLLLFTFSFLLLQPAFGQEDYDDAPEDLVPPPLNFINKDEQKQLEAETKMKERTKLALELMDAKLIKSEEYVKQEDYQESLNQIGQFQGILINTLKFLKFNEDSRGVDKNFKKLEITLRDFMPRLELIRREMPYKYGYHVKRMLSFVRDARTKALNPLFDDTVLPEGNN